MSQEDLQENKLGIEGDSQVNNVSDQEEEIEAAENEGQVEKVDTDTTEADHLEESSGGHATKDRNDVAFVLDDNHEGKLARYSEHTGVRNSPSDVTPKTPRTSRFSYNGPDEQEENDHKLIIMEALQNLPDQGLVEADPAADSKADDVPTSEADPNSEPKTGNAKKPKIERTKKEKSSSARDYDEKTVVAAMQKVPPRHDFTGYIFSSQTLRPYGISNFFLPIVPQPVPRKHICVKGVTVPAQILHSNMRAAPRGLMPLSAVRITWCATPHRTIFTLANLYAYLTRFGPIEAVYQRGPNSSLVVFCDLQSASTCVKCPSLGMPWDRLIATWWEPRLHNNGYLCRHLRVEEHNNNLADLAVQKMVEGEKSRA